MKKLTAVAIAVLVASQAQATEVIKNDTTTLDLTGRAYAGHYFGSKENSDGEKSEKIGANNFIRFGAKGETAVSGSLKAIGEYEAQFNIGNSEKTLAGDKADNNLTTADDKNDGNLRTRLAYAGLKDENWGQVTFGRQKGAISAITDWTDKSLTDGYGNNALGQNTDTYGTGRSADVLKYVGKFDQVGLSASYKLDDTTTKDADKTASDADAYGAALTYSLPMNFTIGTGYNVGKSKTAGVSTDAKLWVAGIKYDDKAFYSAFNYAKGTDFLSAGKDHDGMEFVVGYEFTNGFGVMAMYDLMKVKPASGEKYNGVDYYTLGAQYKFNKNLRVAAEYRINNSDKSATSTDVYKNDMQLAVRYDF